MLTASRLSGAAFHGPVASTQHQVQEWRQVRLPMAEYSGRVTTLGTEIL